MRKVITIDGASFRTLEEFFETIGSTLIPGRKWGRNLDAFNDILRGGFGTPDEGFTLRWINAAISRQRLGESTFNLLVDIIRDHGTGGLQFEDHVELELRENE